jgi:hypothetical protein
LLEIEGEEGKVPEEEEEGKAALLSSMICPSL